MNAKWKNVLFVCVLWSLIASPYHERKIVEAPEPTHENINRLELEGWTPNVSIYAEDGTINRIILKCQAEYVAKVLYGTARYNSEAQQETVVWCILNRLENKWYPNSIEEVCSQPYQFKGYSITNPIEDKLLRVAMDVLIEYYETGRKPCPSDFVYMSTDKEIMLRDSFNETKTTRHWRVADD